MSIAHDIQIFCRNLRQLRISRGLSPEVMAQILTIPAENLLRIEAGDMPPETDVGILYRIFTVFGIWPSQMFGDAFIESRPRP